MEKREVSSIRTALRKVDGHEPGSPTEESFQSRAAMAEPSSPAFANKGSPAPGAPGPVACVPTVGTLPDGPGVRSPGAVVCRGPGFPGKSVDVGPAGCEHASRGARDLAAGVPAG